MLVGYSGAVGKRYNIWRFGFLDFGDVDQVRVREQG